MEKMNFLKELSFDELLCIDGGGLVEDIGYGCHAIECKITSAYNSVKDAVSDWF